MPLTWDVVNRGRLPRAYRGPMVSAYMKSVRLGRAEDACYWFALLDRAGTGADYLSRRLLCSAGEDNLDIAPMLLCEAAMTEGLETRLYAVAASAMGTCWYEHQDGRTYTRARILAGRAAPSPATVTFPQALAAGDVDAAYRILAGARVGRRQLFLLAAEAGAQAADEDTRKLAAIVRAHSRWMASFGELNFLHQLIYRLAHGPFVSSGRTVDAREFEALRANVEARLSREIEAVPSWCLDGVHVSGRDPRFAGDWNGLENMILTFERDRRLDPTRPGVTLQDGGARPGRTPSTRTATRAAQLEKAIAQLEKNLVIWTGRVATTQARLAKAREARQALSGSPDATSPAVTES